MTNITELEERRVEQQPKPPTTTTEEDLTTHGQRRVNLIWEATQAVIAVTITLANVIVATGQALVVKLIHQEHPIVLSSSFFLIVGFYFARTNHTTIGGTGRKPPQVIEGR